jgi:hypothetical protein
MLPRNPIRRPFWLPASNYYILATAIAIIVFFIVWGILHDEYQETPWIPAGISGGCVLIIFVLIRETVLRKTYNNYLIQQQNLSYIVNKSKTNRQTKEKKLTLDKNTIIIKEIEKKSEAAKILGKLSEPHWEVFELCQRYLEISQTELSKVAVGSPRLVALTKSRDKIKNLHKFHLLAWAATESHSLTQESQGRIAMSDKMEFAQKALNILENALHFYPSETQLLDSVSAIKEYIVSVNVKYLMEKAEKAEFNEQIQRAINYYRDALFYLARENNRTAEKELMANQINSKIEKLQGKTLHPTKEN